MGRLREAKLELAFGILPVSASTSTPADLRLGVLLDVLAQRSKAEQHCLIVGMAGYAEAKLCVIGAHFFIPNG